MTGILVNVACKREIHSRTKVKTGCATCRIRKVKCDENKPFCRKCVGTGRTCDGYDGIQSGAGSQPIRPILTEIDPRDIALLNRYFSTKTIFDVELGCKEEAREVLLASLVNPPIRHAVSSLKALREHMEMSGGVPAFVTQHHPSDYGLQQYCMALRGLASNLSSPGLNGVKSALLCCQIFISIEQVRENYAAMAQHIIQGLRIMHQYRARPTFLEGNVLVPAHHEHLPLLDVFVIKLFAAPCKFAEPLATADRSGTTVSVCLNSPVQRPVESRHLRTIAPDIRKELVRIATSTLVFLDKVSRVKLAEDALQMLSEKESLLDSLEAWLIDLELVNRNIRLPGSEPISVSFMRLFQRILNIILLGTLDCSSDLEARLRTEKNILRDLASYVGERVKTYRTSIRAGNGRGEEYR